LNINKKQVENKKNPECPLKKNVFLRVIQSFYDAFKMVKDLIFN
jgi:hypothetical protein